MVPVIGAALSLIAPSVRGWFLIRAVWSEAPRVFRFALGAVLGTGLAGLTYYFVLLVTRSSSISFILSETLLLASILWLARIKVRPKSPSLPATAMNGNSRGISAVFWIVAVFAAIAFTLMLDLKHDGEWDASAVWNMKARFIFRSSEDPVSRIVDPALSDSNPDYPLLLPALVARGWHYAGQTSAIVPISLAAFFSLLTVLIVVSGIQLVTSRSQARLSGCLLLGTPFFL